MRSRSQNAQPPPEVRFLRSRADTVSDVAFQCPERSDLRARADRPQLARVPPAMVPSQSFRQRPQCSPHQSFAAPMTADRLATDRWSQTVPMAVADPKPADRMRARSVVASTWAIALGVALSLTLCTLAIRYRLGTIQGLLLS